VTDNDIFHADVHGGNLLVLEDGRVGFIDFGIGNILITKHKELVSVLAKVHVEENLCHHSYPF
jgi:predicted unusual protein kinase regulating ubiquinone biosynthesis (AarF/ABC1/UbiB family)